MPLERKITHFAAALPLRLILAFAGMSALQLEVSTKLLRTPFDSLTDAGRKGAIVISTFGTTLIFSILMHQISRLPNLFAPTRSYCTQTVFRIHSGHLSVHT